jgi:hypothetical protein
MKNIIVGVLGFFLINSVDCGVLKKENMSDSTLEYTIIFLGSIDSGSIKIVKDNEGKITITPSMDLISAYSPPRAAPPSLSINNELCPLIPELFTINYDTQEIIIDGNTTIFKENNRSWSGGWWKIVVDGNETTYTNANGYWDKTLVEGNKTTQTRSDGMKSITVIDGNTTTEKWSIGNEKSWKKTVIDGNTTMITDSNGYWEKTVIEGNAITKTDSFNRWQKEIIDKNITTYDFGFWEKIKDGNTTKIVTTTHDSMIKVVEENVTTTTWSDGTLLRVVKDGNIIRVTKEQNK